MNEDEARLVEAMRAWLIIEIWGERPGSETWTPKAPADVILRGITRHYPGGIEAFVAQHYDRPESQAA